MWPSAPIVKRELIKNSVLNEFKQWISQSHVDKRKTTGLRGMSII